MIYIFENESSSTNLEYSFLLIRNLIVQCNELLDIYLNSNLLPAIEQVPDHNDPFIMENKVEALSIFLSPQIRQFPFQQNAILIELFHNYFLKTKFDHIKVLFLKVLKHAMHLSIDLSIIISQKEFSNEIIRILQNYNSKRLCRHVLHLLMLLIDNDESFMQKILQSDLLSYITQIMQQNEDRCSSLVLDLLQILYSKGAMDKISFNNSNFLCFESKGYTAKKRFVDFFFWMYSNTEDYLSAYTVEQMEVIINIIVDVMQSNDEDIYKKVIHFYLINEESVYSQMILPYLIEDLEFQNFLQEVDDSSGEANIMFLKLNEIKEVHE